MESCGLARKVYWHFGDNFPPRLAVFFQKMHLQSASHAHTHSHIFHVDNLIKTDNYNGECVKHLQIIFKFIKHFPKKK